MQLVLLSLLGEVYKKVIYRTAVLLYLHSTATPESCELSASDS